MKILLAVIIAGLIASLIVSWVSFLGVLEITRALKELFWEEKK